MAKIDASIYVDLKNVVLVLALTYSILLLASVFRRLIQGAVGKAPHPVFGKLMLGLQALGFAGLGVAMIYQTASLVTLHSNVIMMENDAEYMRKDYPEGQYYYGFQDLSNDLERLIEGLKQKCQAIDRVHAIDQSYFAPAAEYPYESPQSESRANEVALYENWNRAKASVIRLIGDCSNAEKAGLKKTVDTKDHLTYIQVRFRNSLLTISGKLTLVVIASVVATPLICLFLLYQFWKFKRDYEGIAATGFTKSSLLFLRSHMFLAISLLAVVVFSGGLAVAEASSNGAVNTKDVINRYISQSARYTEPAVTNRQEVLQSTLPLVREYLSELAKALRQPKSRIEAGEGENAADINVEALRSLESLLVLEMDIDALVKWISSGVKSSNARPLLLTHMDYLKYMFDKISYVGALVGLISALGVFLVQALQIVVLL